ncbi:hypothetical protein EVAR_5816_1 [Eumeta japonica]|uniref:Reverse transcriptase domain-containing protein n=1 Tax=Eumeta variegata TaxID=151549 RepID=A0A4C1T4P9_EUMVA|nr:hypothetical protein EVAR_5816_1 [Eumeta japonica]
MPQGRDFASEVETATTSTASERQSIWIWERQSTLDAINLLVDTAKEAIARTRWKSGSNKYCLVATLDIKNVFNSANCDYIMQALQKKNIPGCLRKIMASYFSDRVQKSD